MAVAHRSLRIFLPQHHDGGDAETGFGVDIGAGLAWTDPASGVQAMVAEREPEDRVGLRLSLRW